jgi:predicted negative regulator of RcsB-dependent stress response
MFLTLSSTRLSKLVEKNFVGFLAVIILGLTGLSTWKYRAEIFQVTNKAEVGRAYGESQYVLGDKSNQKIDDGTLYTYAAEAYFKGEDPTTINFEHPPLGKYVFGLSL